MDHEPSDPRPLNELTGSDAVVAPSIPDEARAANVANRDRAAEIQDLVEEQALIADAAMNYPDDRALRSKLATVRRALQEARAEQGLSEGATPPQ